MGDTKKVVVCGAGGFIGGHLVKRLRQDGCWVRGVDIKDHEFGPSAANEFLQLDLRDRLSCEAALSVAGGFDEVYQLAADIGGINFIHSVESETMRNNTLINVNVVDAAAAAGVRRYFLSSSMSVYPDVDPGEREVDEADAYPALPDNEDGWQKLYAERVAEAYGRRSGMAVRIARFQNCYGPEGPWRGGREKAPAAICRKVAEVDDGTTIEIWGDSDATRSYTYVDDVVEGIVFLTRSDMVGAVNIGNPEYVTVDELIQAVVRAADKQIEIRHVPGYSSIYTPHFKTTRIRSLGWSPKYSLDQGIALTYRWVEAQLQAALQSGAVTSRSALPLILAPSL